MPTSPRPVDNIFREKMIQKGYVNKTEIARFVPCGYMVAKKIYDAITKDLIDQGIRNYTDIIRTSRLLEYLDFKEADIHKWANWERDSLHDNESASRGI